MSPRILYAEDHDDTRALVSLLLRQEGFDVAEAADAHEALELAAAGSFDLYLLDHGLPDSSGLEVCRALRASYPDTPILFCSGRALPEEREAALWAGAQGYLVKPHDILDVAQHVSELIRSK